MSESNLGVGEVVELQGPPGETGAATGDIAPPRSDAGPTIVLAAGVDKAVGARGAAAALACSGSRSDLAAMFIDFGGPVPRPTLLSSLGARRAEERLAAHFPRERAAARGQLCQLSARTDEAGLETAARAISVSSVDVAVLHLPAELSGDLPSILSRFPISGALLRVDPPASRPSAVRLVHDLMNRGLAVGLLKKRLGWVSERRALFGSLHGDAVDGLPPTLVRYLLGPDWDPARRALDPDSPPPARDNCDA